MFKKKSICSFMKPVLHRINNSENIFCHTVFEDYLDVTTVQFYEPLTLCILLIELELGHLSWVFPI